MQFYNSCLNYVPLGMFQVGIASNMSLTMQYDFQCVNGSIIFGVCYVASSAIPCPSSTIKEV